MKNILVLGADGKLGSFVIADLLKDKNNKVTTFTRKKSLVNGTTNIVGDATDYNQLIKAAKGVDIIISTLGAPSVKDFVNLVSNVTKVAVETKALLIWSGGAGTLIDKDGNQLVNVDDNFWKPGMEFFKVQVMGQRDALNTIKNTNNLKFIYLSPALNMTYERPLSNFKIEATDKALYNKDGNPDIGYQTQAAALVKLVNNNSPYLNKRCTVVES